MAIKKADPDISSIQFRVLPGYAANTVENFITSEYVGTSTPDSTTVTFPMDYYGTFTYLARTVDRSNNWSELIQGAVVQAIRPQDHVVLYSYNEDDPSSIYAGTHNINNAEYNFTSYANTITNGISNNNSSIIDNANGSSSGWSVASGGVTDLLAIGDATYTTQVRDLTYEATISMDAQIVGSQATTTTYNDFRTPIISGISDYNIQNFIWHSNVNVAAWSTTATDLFFSPDGGNLYVLSSNTDDLTQYNLAVSWNVQTATRKSNLSIAPRDVNPTGLFFKPDGLAVYIGGTNQDNVYMYSMTNAWNIQSAVYVQNAWVGANAADPTGISFSPDGGNLYVTSDIMDSLVQYRLNTAWNVMTASLTANMAIVHGETVPRGLYFTDNGYKLYIVGSTRDNVFRYQLTNAWNIQSAAYSSNVHIGQRDNNPNGIYIRESPVEMYISGTVNSKVEKYILSVDAGATVLVDEDFGGIGNWLTNESSYYDANNQTLVSGSGNPRGIWNPGQFVGDIANANSYALIAGVINANAIALGATYWANGNPTGTNIMANIASGGSYYQLVDFTQYYDTDSTYAGPLDGITTKTKIRYAGDTANVFHANGNVNVAAFSSFAKFKGGTYRFRYFQLQTEVKNNSPTQVTYTLDKYRYSINKQKTIFTTEVVYDTVLQKIDYSSANFRYKPSVTALVAEQVDKVANPAIALVIAYNNTNATISLAASKGTGLYAANSTATLMITAIGV